MAFQFVTGYFCIQSLCKKLNEATPPSNKLEDGLDLENILKGGVQSVMNKMFTETRNYYKYKKKVFLKAKS